MRPKVGERIRLTANEHQMSENILGWHQMSTKGWRKHQNDIKGWISHQGVTKWAPKVGEHIKVTPNVGQCIRVTSKYQRFHQSDTTATQVSMDPCRALCSLEMSRARDPWHLAWLASWLCWTAAAAAAASLGGEEKDGCCWSLTAAAAAAGTTWEECGLGRWCCS